MPPEPKKGHQSPPSLWQEFLAGIGIGWVTVRRIPFKGSYQEHDQTGKRRFHPMPYSIHPRFPDQQWLQGGAFSEPPPPYAEPLPRPLPGEPPLVTSGEALRLLGGQLFAHIPGTPDPDSLPAVALRMGESIALARRDGQTLTRVLAPADSQVQSALIELLAAEGYAATVQTWGGPGGGCLEIQVRPRLLREDAPRYAQIEHLGDRDRVVPVRLPKGPPPPPPPTEVG